LAARLITPGGSVPNECGLFRALNPKHYEDGLPGDNHFVMTQNDPVDDGVSTGIRELIKLKRFRRLEHLVSRYGEGFGVAVLNVADILRPVQNTWIRVQQKDAPLWGDFAKAHAIITGYQIVAGMPGRKIMLELQRHLVQLARNNFYPPQPKHLSLLGRCCQVCSIAMQWSRTLRKICR
jgi:hypothetical protein